MEAHDYDDSLCICTVHPTVQVHHARWGCMHAPQPPPSPPPSSVASDVATVDNEDVDDDCRSTRSVRGLGVWDVIDLALERPWISKLPERPAGTDLKFFNVIAGKQTGMFTDRETAEAQVLGFTRGILRSYDDNYPLARDDWVEACASSLVRGSVHRDSIVRYIVSQREVHARIERVGKLATEAMLARISAATSFIRRPSAARSAGGPTADPVAPAAHPTVASAGEAPAGDVPPRPHAGDSELDGNATPGASGSNPAPSTLETEHAGADRATAEQPSDTQSRKGQVKTRPMVPPAAWVVLRGRAPGVCYTKEGYMWSRGTSHTAWGFPAATDDDAHYMWIANGPLVAMLPEQEE